MDIRNILWDFATHHSPRPEEKKNHCYQRYCNLDCPCRIYCYCCELNPLENNWSENDWEQWCYRATCEQIQIWNLWFRYCKEGDTCSEAFGGVWCQERDRSRFVIALLTDESWDKESGFEGESHFCEDLFCAADTGKTSFIETLSIFNDCNFISFITVHALELYFWDFEKRHQGLLDALHHFLWFFNEFRFIFILAFVDWGDFYSAKFEQFIVNFVWFIYFWIFDIYLKEGDIWYKFFDLDFTIFDNNSIYVGY